MKEVPEELAKKEAERNKLYVLGGVNVNLGCNMNPKPTYTNVDIEPREGVDVVADLEERWPFEDDSVDYIWAADIVEHLKDPIHTMNEAWRVLKVGGIIEIYVPSTDGRGAFQDPTHKSFWNKNSFMYYTAGFIHRYLYPAIKCTFHILAGDSKPDADRIITTCAICRKVPLNAEPLVPEGASDNPGHD